MNRSIMFRGAFAAVFSIAGFCFVSELPAAAIGVRSLILGADSEFNLNNMKTAVDASGVLGAPVDVLDVRTGMPSLATLLQYDSLSIHSNFSFPDATALGNLIADYVDRGHGVVVMPFETRRDTLSAYNLLGRWTTGGYDPLPNGGEEITGTWTIASLQQPNHSVLAGVAGIRYSGRFTTAGQLNPLAAPIATWNRGGSPPNSPLAAEVHGFAGRVMLVNVYLSPSDINAQGFRLLANSLRYAAVPEPATMGLLAMGISGALVGRRKRHR